MLVLIAFVRIRLVLSISNILIPPNITSVAYFPPCMFQLFRPSSDYALNHNLVKVILII
jgi:hypothetical protein